MTLPWFLEPEAVAQTRSLLQGKALSLFDYLCEKAWKNGDVPIYERYTATELGLTIPELEKATKDLVSHGVITFIETMKPGKDIYHFAPSLFVDRFQGKEPRRRIPF